MFNWPKTTEGSLSPSGNKIAGNLIDFQLKLITQSVEFDGRFLGSSFNCKMNSHRTFPSCVWRFWPNFLGLANFFE